jgi:RNA polymerase sigma-70 factor (ECF subfamily)
VIENLTDQERLTLGRKLEETWLAHGEELFGYVLSWVRVKTDAEDVLQDVFLRLAQALAKGTIINNLRSYVYSIGRNEALRSIEKKKRIPVPSMELDSILVSAPQDLIDEEVTVSKSLMELPEEQREVIVLKLFQNFTFEEIGKITGVTLKTAASRYRYGIEKMGKGEKR